MKPIVYQDMDLRVRFSRDHAEALRQASKARRDGKRSHWIKCMESAARKRERTAYWLRYWREHDVRIFDPIAFVESGGFTLREI